MAKSIRTKLKLRFRLMFLLWVLGTAPAFAQQNPPVCQETVLTYVHDFLEVFYPELFGKGQRLKLSVIHPADSSWREISGVYFTVLPPSPANYGLVRHGPNGPIREERPDPEGVLLNGSMWLPPLKHGSRIQQVITSSESPELKTLRELVESHPDWSDNQVASALKQAGARFGTEEKKAFISILPFGKTERFLGHLKITSVELRKLYWRVEAEAHFSYGTSARYIFTFEPFEGKLTSLDRMS